MLVCSYKAYLRHLEKNPKKSVLQKIILTFCAVLLVITGIISALFFYQYNLEAPIRAENQYVETAESGFIATKQSINEMLDAFNVAGAKIKIFDNLKEGSAAASGFSTSLDDVNRNISNIETVRGNVIIQKNQLGKFKTPQKFEKINQELLSFYSETTSAIDKLYNQHKFARDLLMSLGPNLYLPVLSENTLWQDGKNEEITAYYQSLKSDANEALARLSRLDPPDEFTSHVKAQTAYLELLVKTADAITNILSQKDDQNGENPTQVEKAYQVLSEANKENAALPEKLLSQKLKLFSVKENLEKFAAVKIHQGSLERKLNDISREQTQIRTYESGRHP